LQRPVFRPAVEGLGPRGRCPNQGLTPNQSSARRAERSLGEHDIEAPRIELIDQLRTDRDVNL